MLASPIPDSLRFATDGTGGSPSSSPPPLPPLPLPLPLPSRPLVPLPLPEPEPELPEPLLDPRPLESSMISLTSAGPSTMTYGTDARIDHAPKVARTEKGTTTALVLVVSPYSPSEYCRPLEACTRVSAPAVLNWASTATTAPARRDWEAFMMDDLTRCLAVRARSVLRGSVDHGRRGWDRCDRADDPRDPPDGPHGDLHGAGVHWAREPLRRPRAGCW